jgi:hypothetical protein
MFATVKLLKGVVTAVLQKGVITFSLAVNSAASLIVESIVTPFSQRVAADFGVYEADACLRTQVLNLVSLNLQNKATFILTPNGYKESKIYALKPTDGSGDLSFTRASTKTRVGPEGLIETVPYNIAAGSEDLTNSFWSKLFCTIGSNVIAAPDGTVTADAIIEDGTNNVHQVSAASLTKTAERIPYRITTYLKAVNRNIASIKFDDVATNIYVRNFDLANGVVGSSFAFGTTGITESFNRITPMGSGVYKCELEVITSTLTNLRISIGGSGAAANQYGEVYQGVNGQQSIVMWGTMITAVSNTRQYQKVTDRFNIPSLDYNQSTCPYINLEPQRTNLLLRSEEFDNAIWQKGNSTALANTVVGPDGISTADSLFETSATGSHNFTQSFNKTATQIQYAFSVYAKPNGRDWIWLEFSDGANAATKYFNITTGALGTGLTSGTFSIQSVFIDSAANGFYRCILVFTTSAIASNLVTIGASLADNTRSFAGDITKGVHLIGAQLEAGSYASSYIKTTAATVTRIADAITTKTGASALIGQTEGTIYFEGIANPAIDSSTKMLGVSIGSANNCIVLYIASGIVGGYIYVGGVNQATQLPFPAFISGKVALVYRSNYTALFVNGVKAGQDLTVVVPACDRFHFSQDGGTNNPFFGKVKNFSLFDTALSDAEAIALTT